MPSDVEVPEVVKGAGAESSRLHHFRPYDHITRTIIEFAAPAICSLERQRVREALLSEKAKRAAIKSLSYRLGHTLNEAAVAVVLEAALDSLEDSDG